MKDECANMNQDELMKKKLDLIQNQFDNIGSNEIESLKKVLNPSKFQ